MSSPQHLPQHLLAVTILASTYQRVTAQDSATGGLSWDRYYRAADIEAFISKLAQNHDHVKIKNLGQTYEKRPLQALIFSKRGKSRTFARKRRRRNTFNQNLKAAKQIQRAAIKKRNIRSKKKKKPVIVIEAGMHAREWISPAVATYIAHQLASASNSEVLKHATWVVVPLLNPDGYEYSHTDDRYWRKNRRHNKGNPDCPGVDLNRNFKKGWATTGSSSNECDYVYHGKKPFSEKETRAMKKLLRKPQNIKLYLSLHSYGQVILHPWGYTSDEPPNVDKLITMANAFSKHIADNGERTYGVEQAGLSYQAGGGSDDYAYSLGIPYSYTVELPDRGTDGFDTPPEKILGISQEFWIGLKCLLGDLVPAAKSLCSS